MAAITFEIPDTLAKYADEQGVLKNPEWFAKVMRASLGRLDPKLAEKRREETKKRERERNQAANKEFIAALKELPPLPGDDLPPRLNLTREFPL